MRVARIPLPWASDCSVSRSFPSSSTRPRPTNSTGFLSTREATYSLLFSVLLALFTLTRAWQSYYSRRGYWLVAFGAIATIASLFVALRFAFAAILAMIAFELFLRRGDDPRPASKGLGDYSRPLRFAIGAGLLCSGSRRGGCSRLPRASRSRIRSGYTNVNVSNLRAIFSTLGWFNANGGAAGDRWIIVLAGVADRRRIRRAGSTRHGARGVDGVVVLDVRARSAERHLESASHPVLVHHDPPRRRLARRVSRLALGESRTARVTEACRST